MNKRIDNAITTINYNITTHSQCPHCLVEDNNVGIYSNIFIFKNKQFKQTSSVSFKCTNINCMKLYSVDITISAKRNKGF